MLKYFETVDEKSVEDQEQYKDAHNGNFKSRNSSSDSSLNNSSLISSSSKSDSDDSN